MGISLAEAARWVAEFEASDLEHRQFADAHGLHYGCIGRYRQRIRRVDNKRAATPVLFHELPSTVSRSPIMDAICIVLPNGYRIEIPPRSVAAIDNGVAALVQQLAQHQCQDQRQGGV